MSIVSNKKELTSVQKLSVMRRVYRNIHKAFVKKDVDFINTMGEGFSDSLPELFKNTRKSILSDGRKSVLDLLPFIDKLETKMKSKELLNDGYVLSNNSKGKKKVLLFSLLGIQFTTNKNRKYRYSLDDNGWFIHTKEITLIDKIKMIIFKDVHILKKEIV